MDSIIKDLSNNFYSNIEQLRSRNDPEALKIVAKEMESIFLQELIKEMRKTTDRSTENSFGNDMYMSMFDMELARVLSERGTGLQKMLIEGLSRLREKHDNNNDNKLNNNDKIASVNEIISYKKRISSLSPPSPLPLQEKELNSSLMRGKGEAFLLPVKKDKGESD